MLGPVKKISVGICGDAKAAAAALTQRPAGRTLACDATLRQRADEIAAEKAAWEKELDEWTHERDPYSPDMIEEQKQERTPNGGHYLHPRRAARTGTRHARRRDGLHRHRQHQLGGQQLPALRQAAQLFAAMSWGNCGYAFPTIIGAKVAAPHRPAISYAGDGAWGMSLMETLTCVRHNIPVTAVVFHNRQWGAEEEPWTSTTAASSRANWTARPSPASRAPWVRKASW